MRNGNRWRVVGVDARTNWLGAERLDDGARVVFDGDCLREHVGLGYAVTVHSAQGVTADTSHAVLGENTSRALLYVALTRGRDNNTAHLYQRTSGDHEPGVQEADGTHVKHRGDSHEAADLIGGILTNHDQPAVTAHDHAARTPSAALPDRVGRLLDRRRSAVQRRRESPETCSTEAQDYVQSTGRDREHAASTCRDQSTDSRMEL